MNYRSANRKVRTILDHPRWMEWIEFEIGYLNRFSAQSIEFRVFWEKYIINSDNKAFLEGYVCRYSERPNGFHEVAELVQMLAKVLPVGYHQWLHRGLTSSNVIDSCNHIRWNRLVELMDQSIESIRWNPIVEGVVTGFTHGKQAHRTSLHHRIASCGFILRPPPKLDEAILGGPTGMDGPSGGQSANRQCVRRSDYWPMWTWLAQIAAACDQLATDYRFYCSDLCRPIGVRGVLSAPVTSSAMPGKQNPSEFERVCSLAYTVRSLVASQFTLPAQWLDRDLVHSAHERETIDQIWECSFHLVELLAGLLQSTRLEITKNPPNPSSHDAMNQFLDSGATYDESRVAAEKYPT